MPDSIDWVEIVHPDIHTDPNVLPSSVARAAFEQEGGWRDRGWQLAPEAPPEPEPAQPTSPAVIVTQPEED